MIALALVTLLSGATDVDRSKQPPPGPEPSWAPPAPAKLSALGMNGLIVERHELPIVELGIAWSLGEVNDPTGKEGMHALCVDLIDEGTKALDKNALEDRKADAGATVVMGAGRESARLDVAVTKERLPAALDIAAGLLLEPGLRSSDFERLKAMRKNAIMQARGNVDGAAGRLAMPALYGFGHPYGKLVTEASLDAVTVQDCVQVAAQLKPEGAEIVVVGDVTPAEIGELLGARLASWKGRAPAKPRIGPPRGAFDGKSKASIYFIDVPGAAQSRVLVGHHGPARGANDYLATTMMTRVFGEGLPSRLVQNLREKNGYTYGANARFAYARSTSTMQLWTSVRTDVTGPALREIKNELSGMSTRAPDDAEVTRERSGWLGALPGQFRSNGATAGAMWELLFYELPLDWWQKLPAQLRTVQTKDVKKAVGDRLKSEGLVVLVAGDRAKVLPELEKIASEKLFGGDGIVVLDADGKRK